MKSTNTEINSKRVSSILINIGAISFRPKKPFKYDSGILSPVYTDNRLLISYPKQWKVIIGEFVKRIKNIGIPDVVAGTATAGIPHAALIARELKIPMIYVRAAPKGHGKGKQIEGVIKKGQKALIIEDLISTGGSSIRVAKALRRQGVRVTDEIAIFTYDLKVSFKNFSDAKIKLHTLTNLEMTANVAVEKGFLKKKQIDMVTSWAKDPKNWANKMGIK